ncbi:hypothetical protein C1645_702342 [Glomus cerebriforme]|uniref:Uncharacterized protein n=1 Tax=Glomus cerebriforme TaxID=658196 RepID=A0A397S533_9GLOM|nr:hypothetical protein C1645_702342 [Glomus cerebriforme]
MASGATCVQRLDGSRDSAIHTKYRISLRSSSMREPGYPLPRVILCFGPPPLPANEKRTNNSLFTSLAHLAPIILVSQDSTMILPQVHLRKPCYDFSFL